MRKSNAVAILISGKPAKVYVEAPDVFSDSDIRALLAVRPGLPQQHARVVSLAGADITELARLHGSAKSQPVTKIGDAPGARADLIPRETRHD